MRAIRVVLCDDAAEIRSMLRMVIELEPDLRVAGEAATGLEAIEQAREHRPDVLLLDLYMPVLGGLDAIPSIRKASPHTRIVVLSGIEAGRAEDQALQLGAVAYLEKGAAPERIVDALRGAASGNGPDESSAPGGGGSGPKAGIVPLGTDAAGR